MRRIVLATMLVLMARTVGEDDPPWTSAELFVPEPYASRIAEHAEQIVENGWGVVAPGDFYHGHLILSRNASALPWFTSLDDAFAHSVGVLYHTDEEVVRWNAQRGRLVRDRTPRSIVGLWGVPVFPASWFFEKSDIDAVNYESYGTIDTRDLMRVAPDRFHAHWTYELRRADMRCWTVLQFNIQFWEPPEFSRVRIHNRWYALTVACHPS